MPSNDTNQRDSEATEDRNARLVDIRTALKEVTRILHKRQESGPGLSGLPTGFAVLDELLGGLQPKYLYVVASRPSMGRTTFALNIVQHLTLDGGKRAAVFSLQESASSVTFRLLASIGRVKTSHLRTAELDEDERARLSEASSRLTDTNAIFLGDSATLSVADLCAIARQSKEEQSIDLLVVDNVENLRIPANTTNGSAKLREITRSLKTLAEELNIPVVATTRLGRSVEERDDHRPTMLDFDEPKAVDQYADVVFFIYRDAFYNQVAENERYITDIIVARNRDGDTFAIKLLFQEDYLRFEDQ